MVCEWCGQTITSDRAWLREPIGALCAGCCERWDGGERPGSLQAGGTEAEIMRNRRGGITLGALIDRLERVEHRNRAMPWGIGPGMSYRGYYECAGFEPKIDVLASDMLIHARALLGTVQHGYKGGDYRMTTETECFVAVYGDTGIPLTPELLEAIFDCE